MAAMSLTAVGKVGGKKLTCAVCCEIYRSPRILPCFHTFCLYCLEGLARTHGQRFPCPSCRRPTTVPPDGALGFQMNFYITEDELEKERKAPNIAMCTVHEMEPLVFFCVDCDEAICIRCCITKHSSHQRKEDLSEAAARSTVYLEQSKKRLDSTIRALAKASVQTQEHRRAAKRKGEALKEQVQINHGVLVKKIRASFDKVLGEIEASNNAVQQTLTLDAQSVQKELDSLVQLRQSVHHALTAEASDADRVRMEKEMRDGEGSEDHLLSIKNSIPATTLRPGLRFRPDVFNDADLCRVLGKPVKLRMAFAVAEESIVSVFQCRKTEDTEGVRGICQLNREETLVYMWKTSSDESVKFTIDETGRLCKEKRTLNRKTWKRWKEDKIFITKFKTKSVAGNDHFCLNSKGHRTQNLKVHHIPAEKKTSVFKVEVSGEPFKMEKVHVFDTNHAMPAAFDATDTGEVIALVEISPSEQSVSASKPERQVCLYRKEQDGPFATYTPKFANFCPSDVCFWQEDNQDMLLVADRQNDCVHVVSIHEAEARFERCLAAGDGQLVRPTALNVDDKGRVWIGCENGSVLRCEKQLEPESQNTVDESDEDNGSDDLTFPTESPWEDRVSSLLMVENSSTAINTPSQLSEAAE